MNKYIAIFRIPTATIDEWRASTDQAKMQETNQKMMDDMNAWMKVHEASFVDRGMPLGKTKTITAQGVSDSRNDLVYILIVQAASHDDAVAIFKDCPHNQIPTSSIDVIEVPHMGV